MVGFTTRFALLAALSSIAALTVLPAPVRGGLVNANTQDLGPSIAARHSLHGEASRAAADADGDHSVDGKHDRKHHKSSDGKPDTSTDSSSIQGQQSHTPFAPLPSPLAAHASKALKKEGKKKDERTAPRRPKAKGKHAKQGREVYSIDPVTRMRSLWVGGGITVRDVQLETLPPRLDKRHHHHHHHHHHHGPGSDKVVVKGDDDNVHVHRRSGSLVTPPARVSDPGVEPGDVLVEGTNDHIHIPDHRRDGNHSPVVVKGDNGHTHVRRDPMHHRHGTVVVKGDDQHVHVHREPAPHHHHHPEKVVVNGDNDRVHVHHARSPRRPRPHHHHSEVVVNGDNDGVHIHRRAPRRRRHHRYKAVVEGDHQHVHFSRSPVAFPEPHHRHHSPDKVVVKGHDDHVGIHRKRFTDYGHPIIIGGNRGKAYLIPQKEPVIDSLVSGPAFTKRHVRRDAPFTGVPGTVEIMSQDSESKGKRIACLVVATPSNNSTVAGSPFVLNASDTDRTQMYLVPANSATNGTSASSNSTSSLPADPPAPPSTGLPVPSSSSTPPAVNSATDMRSFVKVLLQTPIFDAASAQLKPYCATFDPRPLSPAPMTVEECNNALSDASHKSQIFAYEPDTGYIRPMWYDGEDDGTSDDDSAPSASPVPSAAPASPPSGPSGGPPSPPVNSSPPVSTGAPMVTSFEQEALEDEFGDSTHAPVMAPEIFAAEALQNARNVTLMFAPTTPEVLPNSGVGKVAELPGASVPVSPPVANPVTTPGAGTDAAAGSATPSATASSSSDTDSGATTTTATTTSATGTEAGTTDASATDAGSSAAATPSDDGAGDSMSAQDLLAPATPTQALDVDAYDADASDTADGLSSSGSSSGSSTDSASASDTGSTDGTDSASASSTPTMTPVSTAPYEWMFKGTNASP